MNVGIAVADITPTEPFSLSGFVARQNKPSEGFADPIFVRCLALGSDDRPHLLFAYDLLGIGADLLTQLSNSLAKELGSQFSFDRAIFTSTHNHSAPATVFLANCGIIEQSYWKQVVEGTVQAARDAIRNRKEARLHVAQRPIKNLIYNRRRLLENGRISMAFQPNDKVASVGPVDELLTVLGWREPSGRYIAAGVHFACHPVINASQVGTAEFPGQLCRHVERALGAPCLFLQGAAGDINPIRIIQGMEALAQFNRDVAAQLNGVAEEMKPIATSRLRSAVGSVPLGYERALDWEKLRAEMEQMELVGSWQPGAASAQDALLTMANIMNCAPNAIGDPAPHVFNARTLAGCARRILDAKEKPLPPCPLSTAVWDLGGVQFHFAAAELFAVTGLCLKQLAPDKVCLPVGCCAPLVGYLPTREATKQGGYEADYAWRYYGHLAPFAADSEEKVRQLFQELLKEIS